MAGPAGHQKKSWRPDPIGAKDDDLRPLPSIAPVGVDIDDTRREVVVRDLDLLDARIGDEARASLQRERPVRTIGCRLRALGAAGEAGAASDARVELAELLGRDGVAPRPPVPAHTPHAERSTAPDRAHRQRWEGVAPTRRKSWIAGKAGHADLALDFELIRQEILVSVGPVVRDAVKRADAKI